MGGVEDQSWPGNLSKVDYAESDSLRLVSFRRFWFETPVVETTGCKIKPVKTGSWVWIDQPILIGLDVTDPGLNPGSSTE